MPELMTTDFNLDGKTPAELEQIRDTIVRKANGDYKSLSDDDLKMMAAVTATMRRRSAGPPKAPKEKKGKTSPKSDGDLLNMI